MYIIKLDAIDSTNSYVKQLCAKKKPMDFTVVVTEEQTQGRGQLGANWQSEASKNLTFSVFKEFDDMQINNQFFISMAVSLGIVDALRALQIPKIKIKWPNDILSDDKKIAGILIENVIKNNSLEGSIIGIGLNVNQKFFNNLPRASSLHLITGIVYDNDEVLHVVLKHIKNQLNVLGSSNFETLKKDYESLLFRRKKPSTFKSPNGDSFLGFIEGVTKEGKLRLTLEDNISKTFDLKDLQLLY